MEKATKCCGTVIAVHGAYAEIETHSDMSSCRGCSVAALCKPGAESFRLTVALDSSSPVKPGDEVHLYAVEASRWMAIVVCFLVPVLLMCLGCLLMLATGASQALAALAALALPAAYFVMLYLMRRLGYSPWESKVWKIES